MMLLPGRNDRSHLGRLSQQVVITRQDAITHQSAVIHQVAITDQGAIKVAGNEPRYFKPFGNTVFTASAL